MKYCLNYSRGRKILGDEINITYHSKEVDLYSFLREYPDKRVNLYLAFGSNTEYDEFKNSKFLSNLAKIKKENPDIQVYLKLENRDLADAELINKIKENNIPFFSDLMVKDWDEFQGLLSMGVSDIYIVENMCFQLDICADAAHVANVALRVIPNLAQSSWIGTPAYKKFFIRPEDVIQYEPYIDTLEFATKKNILEEDTLYEIYAEKKAWFGPLKEIIIGLDDDLDGRYVVPRFAENRIKCGKRCMKKPGSCNICDAVVELSKTLEKHDIIVKTKKD